MLCELCVEIDDPDEIASILDVVAERADQHPGVFRLRLARGALGAPELLELRQDVATRALLVMASVLAPVSQLSVWQYDAEEDAVLLGQVGDPLHAPEPDDLGPDDLLVFPVASGASRVLLVTRVAPEKHVLGRAGARARRPRLSARSWSAARCSSAAATGNRRSRTRASAGSSGSRSTSTTARFRTWPGSPET